MIINTAATEPRHTSSRIRFTAPLACLALFVACTLSSFAGPTMGPWIPIFKGVEHAVGTNIPGISGNFTERQVVHCIRVDLSDPDVQLFATPRASTYVAESRETLSQTTSNFLKLNHLQVAADANYYNANPGGADPSSEGIPCEVYGLQIVTGMVVSATTTTDYSGDPRSASLLFSTNKTPIFAINNRPPGTNTAGIYNAITGFYPIVSNGVNIGASAATNYPDSFIHQVQPRTAYGVSQDNRYLFLMTIDGRQSGYSDGALDQETAYWMLQVGAYNAINMDGGGSTAMYMADSVGNPVPVNHSSYVAAYQHERYVGSSFGFTAKPLPGFFNDVTALPDDTAATITWTTTSPSTTQVKYGLTTNLNFSTTLQTALVTNHAALLTGLTPGTPYYFAAYSQAGTTLNISSNFLFVTTNFATTNLVFDLPNTWNYTTADLDGVNWTAPHYDDSGWEGSGPGVLWADARGDIQTGIPEPGTQMPIDSANTGYPFITYYFRTHFNCANPTGASLVFTTYLDDGAVVYLNGAELTRLYMPAAPAVIQNNTLSSGYACSGGNATCPIPWTVPAPVTNLVAGDNVLAVEVHNYTAGSPDITFGTSLSLAFSFANPPQLQFNYSGQGLVLSWSRGGFTLQQASSVRGPWTDVAGPVVSSPYTVTNLAAGAFFRLKK